MKSGQKSDDKLVYRMVFGQISWADKARSDSDRPQRGMRSIPSLRVLNSYERPPKSQ